MQLDLCSLKSVREFAEEVLEREERLDVLINNAGCLAPLKRTDTEDGLEMTLQSNYLGHFLLTNLLIERLKRSAPSRIINVGSITHWLGKFDGDIDSMGYNRHQVYANTKLFNMLFTIELAGRLAGSGVTANCCHPGAVQSSLTEHHGDLFTRIVTFGVRMIGKSAEDGAQTSVYLAVSEDVENISGKMFADCKPSWAPGKPEDVHKLWEISERITGLS
ncbi:retinol dehydrogenase 13-like [Amblyomma americanum]